MDANTVLYAVFGNPVRHSKSPVIHNPCFLKHDLNSVYLAFEIEDIKQGISAIRTLDIKGASITIPFKKSVMDELDWIDEDARQIGAVNTIVNDSGRLKGYNTDMKGAILPLKPFDIKNKTACIIGAGGAALAVAWGLYKEKADIIIVNRDPEKGRQLAEKISGQFIALSDVDQLKNRSVDILINTTSIGMFPDTGRQPVPSGLLNPDMVVMDIVYNPLRTRLLQEAEKTGCKIIDGLSMFLIQGAAQFELWTGIWPDLELMKNAVQKENHS